MIGTLLNCCCCCCSFFTAERLLLVNQCPGCNVAALGHHSDSQAAKHILAKKVRALQQGLGPLSIDSQSPSSMHISKVTFHEVPAYKLRNRRCETVRALIDLLIPTVASAPEPSEHILYWVQRFHHAIGRNALQFQPRTTR